eukprot:4068042-Lingulodinium_polyedra.AAC.1
MRKHVPKNNSSALFHATGATTTDTNNWSWWSSNDFLNEVFAQQPGVNLRIPREKLCVGDPGQHQRSFA